MSPGQDRFASSPVQVSAPIRVFLLAIAALVAHFWRKSL